MNTGVHKSFVKDISVCYYWSLHDVVIRVKTHFKFSDIIILTAIDLICHFCMAWFSVDQMDLFLNFISLVYLLRPVI